ncbi:hypothetical protein [Streptomyces sp. NPDC002580]|uniref:hypothetical protein n=1 Tax=Streptomyces sp. NPDC002580 TaxID=3364653 RepID=UPI00367F37AF
MDAHHTMKFLPPSLLSTPFTPVAEGPADTRAGKTVIDGAVDLGDSLRTCDLDRPPSLTVRPSTSPRWPADTLTARWHADWRERHADEYSGPKVAVHRLRTRAGGQSEIEVTPTDWGQVQGAQAGFLALHGHSPGRTAFLSELLSGSRAPVPNITAVHGVIETADNMLVMNRRSHHVNYHPLSWSCSFEEGMEPDDLDADSPAFETAAARGIAEEFGVQAGRDGLTVLGLLGDIAAMSVAAVVHCRIPVPAESLGIRPKAARVPDAWEHTGQVLVPASPESLAGLLLGATVPRSATGPAGSDPGQGHASSFWHPTSRFRLLLTMLFRFGRTRTAEALARAAAARHGRLAAEGP